RTSCDLCSRTAEMKIDVYPEGRRSKITRTSREHVLDGLHEASRWGDKLDTDQILWRKALGFDSPDMTDPRLDAHLFAVNLEHDWLPRFGHRRDGRLDQSAAGADVEHPRCLAELQGSPQRADDFQSQMGASIT